MARLAGVDIPREKRLEIALTYIYGVGKTRAHETLAATGISADVRVKDLTDAQLVELRDYIEGNYKVEGDLRREVAADIRRKVEIGSYEGIRHRKGLPVRGYSCPAVPLSETRSAYEDERAYPQGPEAHHRRQEEGPLIPEGLTRFSPDNFL